MIIRHVQKSDKEFWFKLDKHLSENELDNKIRDKMGYVLLENNTPIAILRYNLFWDNIPFCTMIFVTPKYQHKGYGRIIMDSTQSDESAQHFYRKLNYNDAGGLIIDIEHYKQPMELFFTKSI